MRVSVAGSMNLSWAEVREAAGLADELGFFAFYTADHLEAVAGFADEVGLLDGVALLLSLAPVTERIRLGALVSPVMVRPPVVLARTLQTLDHVSGGRAEVGLGAGWDRGEHRTFGLDFPPTKERLDRLDDACALLHALWEGAEAVSRDGYYPLDGARLVPRPVQPELPLLVAGASDRAVGIAARWARRWNVTGSPAFVAERVARLRTAEAEAGRPVGAVEATVLVRAVFTAEPERIERLREGARRQAARPTAQARAVAAGEDPAEAVYVGPLEGVSERIAAFGAVGVDHVILGVPRPWDPAELSAMARTAGLGEAGATTGGAR
ncbi:MAG TPA: LLM class flavin-dependent oxidoreductase [Acidimicrobiales bacterium]|nr:LLM class flavin-dependent oxidoreductase [Acidimicrobiales bacterium]